MTCRDCGGKLEVERNVSPFCYMGHARCINCNAMGSLKSLSEELNPKRKETEVTLMQEIGGFFERLDAVRKGEVMFDPTLVPEDTPLRDYGPCKKAGCNDRDVCFHDGFDPLDCKFLKMLSHGFFSKYRNL